MTNGEKKPPTTTAGHLQHDANYYKSQWSGGEVGEVDDEDFFSDGDDEGDQNLVLPSARSFGHPDLPEVDIRPPEFLKPLEAMKDVYMKVRGRMSRRTQELLEGIDLEDLVDTLRALFKDEKLLRSGEARLNAKVRAILKDDPGPLLLGLSDPRLSEPWRLFLDDWDIWVPEGDEGGVDLFWEGEGEDDDGKVITLLQSLTYKNGELSLYVRLPDVEDRVTFDGETFYRLRVDAEKDAERAAAREADDW